MPDGAGAHVRQGAKSRQRVSRTTLGGGARTAGDSARGGRDRDGRHVGGDRGDREQPVDGGIVRPFPCSCSSQRCAALLPGSRLPPGSRLRLPRLSGALLRLPGAPAPAPAPRPLRVGRPFSRRPGARSYAPWCGHCKAFAPVWEEVAEKLGPSTGLKFAKVDATYEPESAGKFGVKSYPKIFYLEKSYAQDVRPAAPRRPCLPAPLTLASRAPRACTASSRAAATRTRWRSSCTRS